MPEPAESDLPDANAIMAELAAALSSGERALDPESLVTIAEARLADIDGQIGQVMTTLSENSQRVEDLNLRIQALQLVRAALSTEHGLTDPDHFGAVVDVHVDWQGQQVEVYELLKELGIKGLISNSGIRLGALDDRINALKTESSGLNSGNELEMIRLQTLMSQRTQVIELATRMLSSLNESQMAIIRNMGR